MTIPNTSNVMYVDSRGNTYDLMVMDRRRIKTASFHEYEWEKTVNEQQFGERLRAWRKSAKQIPVTLLFDGSDRGALLNQFHDALEYDIIHMQPGTLYWEDYHIKCYGISSKTYPDQDYKTSTANDIVFYAPNPWWIKVKQEVFLSENAINSIDGIENPDIQSHSEQVTLSNDMIMFPDESLDYAVILPCDIENLYSFDSLSTSTGVELDISNSRFYPYPIGNKCYATVDFEVESYAVSIDCDLDDFYSLTSITANGEPIKNIRSYITYADGITNTFYVDEPVVSTLKVYLDDEETLDYTLLNSYISFTEIPEEETEIRFEYASQNDEYFDATTSYAFPYEIAATMEELEVDEILEDDDEMGEEEGSTKCYITIPEGYAGQTLTITYEKKVQEEEIQDEEIEEEPEDIDEDEEDFDTYSVTEISIVPTYMNSFPRNVGDYIGVPLLASFRTSSIDDLSNGDRFYNDDVLDSKYILTIYGKGAVDQDGDPIEVYEAVENPVVEDINIYYELINGEYVITEDTVIDPNKTYYIQTNVPVEDPIIIIRNDDPMADLLIIKFDNTLVLENQTLVVDSTDKTVYLNTFDPETGDLVMSENYFSHRSLNDEHYLWYEIAGGYNTVTWSDDYDFTLQLIEERSEPKWPTD